MQTINDLNLDHFEPPPELGGGFDAGDILPGPRDETADAGVFGMLRHIFSGGDILPLGEQEISRLLEQLVEWGLTDPLTGLPNRRMFSQRLEEEHQRSLRSGRAFGLLIMDLDHFKLINDVYGHQEGDRILRAIGECLQEQLRRTDFLARYGGEEFTCILPETCEQDALVVADKMLRSVRSMDPPAPTISIGVAGWKDGLRPDELLSRADEALYTAKRGGRDRVEVHAKQGVSAEVELATA